MARKKKEIVEKYHDLKKGETKRIRKMGSIIEVKDIITRILRKIL